MESVLSFIFIIPVLEVPDELFIRRIWFISNKISNKNSKYRITFLLRLNQYLISLHKYIFVVINLEILELLISKVLEKQSFPQDDILKFICKAFLEMVQTTVVFLFKTGIFFDESKKRFFADDLDIAVVNGLDIGSAGGVC